MRSGSKSAKGIDGAGARDIERDVSHFKKQEVTGVAITPHPLFSDLVFSVGLQESPARSLDSKEIGTKVSP
jgi:hypothetical protein